MPQLGTHRRCASAKLPSPRRIPFASCWALLASSLFVAPALTDAQPPLPERVERLTPESFQNTLARLTGSDGRLPTGLRLELAPGTYAFEPRAYVDSTCGNCEEPNTLVPASLGWRVAGSRIVITSRCDGAPASPDSVRLYTHAGYGILFEHCDDCHLEGVSITGGARDSDGRATDAAIVVKQSSVRIEHCTIRDNIGDVRVVQEQVVGIIGIAGREGARLEIRNNRILRNSWDGIALYRGAEATILDNVIDGIDKARGKQIGGGRGVGIGITWDAQAAVHRNRVTRYWKGIGIFVDAQASVSRNVVEDVLTWGIAYWDAGQGKPVAWIEENLVYDTGACGISLTRDRSPEPGDPLPGFCRHNLVVRSGQNPKYDAPEDYCAQQPIAIESLPPNFAVEDNWLYENRRAPGGNADGIAKEDHDAVALRRLGRDLYDTLSVCPALRESPALAILRSTLSVGE